MLIKYFCYAKYKCIWLDYSKKLLANIYKQIVFLHDSKIGCEFLAVETSILWKLSISFPEDEISSINITWELWNF